MAAIKGIVHHKFKCSSERGFGFWQSRGATNRKTLCWENCICLMVTWQTGRKPKRSVSTEAGNQLIVSVPGTSLTRSLAHTHTHTFMPSKPDWLAAAEGDAQVSPIDADQQWPTFNLHSLKRSAQPLLMKHDHILNTKSHLRITLNFIFLKAIQYLKKISYLQSYKTIMCAILNGDLLGSEPQW